MLQLHRAPLPTSRRSAKIPLGVSAQHRGGGIRPLGVMFKTPLSVRSAQHRGERHPPSRCPAISRRSRRSTDQKHHPSARCSSYIAPRSLRAGAAPSSGAAPRQATSALSVSSSDRPGGSRCPELGHPADGPLEVDRVPAVHPACLNGVPAFDRDADRRHHVHGQAHTAVEPRPRSPYGHGTNYRLRRRLQTVPPRCVRLLSLSGAV